MNRVLIWDVPTRIFHWLFAAGFTGAFLIAAFVDDDSPTFALHMLLGLGIVFLVALRIVWGFVGTRHARFGAFLFGPRALIDYFAGMFSAEKRKRYAGHNPASAVAIFAMLLLAIGLAITGILRSGRGEAFEELHAVLAYGFAVVALGHVLGVLIHTIRHRENITRSMIDGRKQADASEGISSSQALPGLAFTALVGLCSWRLAAGYNPAAGTVSIPMTGQTLQLGEQAEGGEKDGARKAGGEHDHDHDHDRD